MVGERLTIVADTREQLPYDFDPDRVEIVRRALPAGDYAVEGHEFDAVVERKTLDDFVATVIRARDRFHKEVRQLARARFGCVVVEGSARDLVDGHYRSGADPRSVLGATLSLIVDFGVPVYFCADRAAACLFVERYLARCARVLAHGHQENDLGFPTARRRGALLGRLKPEIRSAYERYELMLLRQIVKGAHEHGDASLALSDADIEWQKLEELVDADVGWSFVAFTKRLRALEAAGA